MAKLSFSLLQFTQALFDMVLARGRLITKTTLALDYMSKHNLFDLSWHNYSSYLAKQLGLFFSFYEMGYTCQMGKSVRATVLWLGRNTLF